MRETVMSDIAIRVENLSKQCRIGGPRARYLKRRDPFTSTSSVQATDLS